MKKSNIFFSILILFFSCKIAISKTIIVNSGTSITDKRYKYSIELLKLIVSEVDKKIKVKTLNIKSQPDIEQKLIKGIIQVGILPNHKEEYNPKIKYIPYPLRKGLLGFRSIISLRTSKDIKTLEELTSKRLGYISSWNDYFIYTENDFNIVSTTNYLNLYTLLFSKKTDYLSRSIIELEDELKVLKDRKKKIKIQNILLYYPYSDFFYIKKENTQLEKILVKGFQKSIKDGSWLKLLRTYYQKKLSNLSLNDKKLIKIDNPTISNNYVNSLYNWMSFNDLLKFVEKN